MSRLRSGILGGRGAGPRVRWFQVLGAAFALLVAVGIGSAAADETPSVEAGSGPTLQQLEDAHWRPLSATEPTDSSAAAELPHDELDRTEAGELLTSVFQPVLEEANGVYDEVEVERYDSNYEAVVRPDGGIESPALLESTLPLRVENEEGQLAPVDLGLESTEGELRPANPLVEVGVPTSLDEGIALPEAGLTLKLAGQEGQLDASTLEEGGAAFYPNVAEDTDLTVIPNPLGVETMTQVRTPEAPDTQTFELELAPGQTLREAGDGGAEVVAEGKTVMAVHAASAIDASGEDVPATMTTAGDSLTITVEPDEATTYPILVDPIWDVYVWGQYGGPRPDHSGWTTYQNTGAIYPAEQQGGYWGLTLNSWSGPTPVLSQARWDWHVPRWAQDKAEGKTPSSYIVNAWGGYIDFDTEAAANGGNITTDPFLDLYLWDEATGFVGGYYYRHYGTEGDIDAPSASYPLPGYGDTNAKQMSFELVTTSNATQYRHIFLGYAKMEIADNDNPILSGTSNPSGWVNNSPNIPLPFSIEDTGLGVWALNLGQPTTSGSGWTGFTTRYGTCTGGSAAPCPRTWTSAGGPAVTYDPSQMPQGEDTIQLQAIDPLGHGSTVANEIVKVDHTKPVLTATGTYGEEGTPAEPAYTVKYKVADGTAASPQSGAVSLQIKVDGKTERSLTPGCATKNCEISGELTLAASKFGSGTHTVEVTAADGVGLPATPVTLSFSLERPDTVIDSGPQGLTNQSTPKFTYHSVPSGSTFKCSVDGGAFVSCPATGYTTVTLTEGPHVFEVKAVNAAGLADATPARREFTTVYAPETTITFGPAGLNTVTRPTFAYESNNPEAFFECKVDSESFSPCNPVETEVFEDSAGKELSNGAHTFSVRAVSQLGDADPTPATRSITVDAVPPTAEITSGPAGPSSDALPTFGLTVSGATAECVLETQAEAESEAEGELGEGESGFDTCTTSSSYTPSSPLAEGSYEFRVHAEDEAGNETENVRWFSIDTAVPQTTITSAPPSTTDDATPTFEFASSEPGSTFQCRYGIGAFRACSGPGATDIPTAALVAGSHTFEVRATDEAGNVDGSPAAATFTLVTNGPQTSINSGPEGAIGVTEATFTYAADESSSFECRLDEGAYSACAAGGKTYTGLSQGQHVFEVRGKNSGGIVDPTPARRAFIVDTSSPSNPVLNGAVFEPEGYGLGFEVEVSDGSNDSPQNMRSGIRTVQIILGGEVVRELGAECQASVCPPNFVRKGQIPYEALLAAPAGSSLEAKAIDGKGHSSASASQIREPHDHVVELSEGSEGGAEAGLRSLAVQVPGCNEVATTEHVTRHRNRLVGSGNADLMVWQPGIGVMIGKGGCDVIIGGSGPQTIKGGSGDDLIRGGGSNDHIHGGIGNDRIFGGIGDDFLYGESGEDVIDGGPGADLEKGEAGNDTLRGGQGSDELLGGTQTNTVSFADALPLGFVETEEKGKIDFDLREGAKGKGIERFPDESESGYYINLDQGRAFGGKLAQGGGIDTFKSDQIVVGSPFSDWFEGSGSEVAAIEPGPGPDVVVNQGSVNVHGEEAGVDFVEGKSSSRSVAKADIKKIRIGAYKGGDETNVYVIGSKDHDVLNVNPSGSAVKVTVNGPVDLEPGCKKTGKNAYSCADGKKLGALVIFGGRGADEINMEDEDKDIPGGIELDGGPAPDHLNGGAEEEFIVDGVLHGNSSNPDVLVGAGGEDALSQGQGKDTVEGGPGSDLFLNERICEGDAVYANEPGVKAGSELDNAQFHPLPNLGVYLNMKTDKIAGKGENNGTKFNWNCGKGPRETYEGFNDFEGSPQGDWVIGNARHNYIIGRGGENKLFGGPGNDLINARNEHPELKINCGGQKKDKVSLDHWDREYLKEWKKTCHVEKGKRGNKTYTDEQTPGANPGRKKEGTGSPKPSAMLAGSDVLTSDALTLNAMEEEGFLEEEGADVFPTAEFALDETSGTTAVNSIEEGPAGTYMARGGGPSVNGPGPGLGGESALFGGEESGEEEGSSISLNGEKAYVDLAGQAGPSGDEEGYSLALYVKFAKALGQREYIFSTSTASGEGAYLYRAPNGSIVFTTGQGPGAPSVSSDPIGAGGWHQIVASLEGDVISLNVDGFPYVLDYGGNVVPRATASPESLLGAGPGVTDLLAGSLDDVASYEGVMSENEILTLIASSKAQIAEYLPIAAPETADEDGDGVPDGIDNCPATANADQADVNQDGIGDACETLDEDGDGVPNSSDDCPSVYNPEQTDSNKDGVGDACSILPPEAETGTATAVKANTATIAGSVDPQGTATTYEFEYGTTEAYGKYAPATAASAGAGAAAVPVTVALSGLTAGTTYHYRLVATNEWGTEAGEDGTFTTLTQPAVTISAATAISNTSAVLHGSVDPEGLETTYQFEYGTTTNYGNKAPATAPSAGSGTSAVAVSTPLTGLVAGTTYYYRVAATSAGGTAYSGSSTFTTAGGAISGAQLAAMPVTESFDGSSTSLSNFASKWAALGWAGGTTPKGSDTTAGWGPYDAFSTVDGAYYNTTLTDTGSGLAAVATLGTSPGITERYFSLWLDMSNPTATTRSGYELRFTDIGTNLYKATLSRWSAGVQTVLATEASYALPVGSSLALTDQGSTVTAWTNTGSGFVKLIGATNSEFSGGRAGVEGSGNYTRLKNFKFAVPGGSGEGGGSAMNTALQNLTLRDAFATAENPLSEGGNWAALQWDSSTTGHNTGQVSAGWGPYDAFSTVNGAYWHESFADSGTGDAVTATMTYGPRVVERYFSLWLNAASPGTVKSGYELRFYESATGTFTVTISRWSSGTKTVLATQTGFTFAAGGKVALVEKAGTVSAWTAPASGEFTQLVSATDTTYTSGRPAVEASGNGTRLTNLRAGALPAF